MLSVGKLSTASFVGAGDTFVSWGADVTVSEAFLLEALLEGSSSRVCGAGGMTTCSSAGGISGSIGFCATTSAGGDAFCAGAGAALPKSKSDEGET